MERMTFLDYAPNTKGYRRLSILA
uniref:Uncharacterized protein n=1 Tax=Moniliophthora roreri TaxID=221103 RepID=A0A0W0FB95_MONRR